MYLKSKPLLAAVVMLLFFSMLIRTVPSTATVSSSESLEPHDFRAYGMDCRSCHTSVGVKKSGGMVKPVREICHGCHPLAGLTSHPSDVKPSFPIPADFPLDENGMTTCATCHNPHKAYRNALTGKKTMYLRREIPPKEFCMICHKNQ